MEQLPERKSHRLKEWDYSQNGYYFVTVCTHDRQQLFATVNNTLPGSIPDMRPTEIGQAVSEAWDRLSKIDPNVKTDAFCLMPNHIHGIIIIDNQPECDAAERRGRRSLHDLIRRSKSVTTRQYNKLYPDKNQPLWQSSFYDTVIRNDDMLYEIRKYIIENPIKWSEDKYYAL